MKFLNPWTSKKDKLVFFNMENKPVFNIGDYAIYRQSPECYLYTFKNLGINQLAGLNKEHLIALHEDNQPTEPQRGFLFDRAKESLQKGLNLIN